MMMVLIVVVAVFSPALFKFTVEKHVGAFCFVIVAVVARHFPVRVLCLPLLKVCVLRLCFDSVC